MTVIPGFLDNGREWAPCFGLSWAELLLRDQAISQQIIRPGGQYFRKVAGTMGVAAGRNEIVERFLASDAEWLWFVDTDMGFSPDTVDRMVASAEVNDADVLGALCFAQKQDPDLAEAPFHGQRFRIIPTLYEFLEIEGSGEKGFRHLAKYRRDQFQTVAGTGAACLLIDRPALEILGPNPFSPITLADGGGQGMPRTYSEDLSFCIRAAAAGLKVGVDAAIKTTHCKGGIFLDETAYAMQQETLIQAKGHEIAQLAQWAARRQDGPFGKVEGVMAG